MKKLIKAILGIILLVISFMLASEAGKNLAGGGNTGNKERQIQLGTVKIDYTINGN